MHSRSSAVSPGEVRQVDVALRATLIPVGPLRSAIARGESEVALARRWLTSVAVIREAIRLHDLEGVAVPAEWGLFDEGLVARTCRVVRGLWSRGRRSA